MSETKAMTEKEQVIASLVEKHRNDTRFEHAYTYATSVRMLSELYDLLAPKWVSVEDRLPEAEKMVYALFSDGKNACEAFYDGSKWVTGIAASMTITHWTTLPQPPKEKP